MEVDLAEARHTAYARWCRLRLLLCAIAAPRFVGDPPAYLPARDMTDAAAIRDRFRERGFIVDEAFATALQIMLALEKPLLVEGPAGVGKTESAKVLADVLGTRLIRLQCYEGLDAMSALYEWNYPRQMLHARLSEGGGATLAEREAADFSEPFLLKRPLLEAITAGSIAGAALDEVDRADEAFEAFLLEVLAEWQVTIPELGTIRARHKPHVDPDQQPDEGTVGRAQAARACSCGFRTRRSNRRSRSCTHAHPGCRDRSRIRSRRSCRSCAPCRCRRRRAWPRASTGPRR